MAADSYGSGKRNGRHFTPPDLAEFLAERAAHHLPPGRRLRILDPACGDGELLLAASAALTARGHTIEEIIGCEIDPETADRARERIAPLGGTVHIHAGDFLAATDHTDRYGHFELIITNPPYVRTQVLGATQSSALANRFGLSGRVDLTHPFVTLSAALLRPGGVLALLCSNRFLTTRAGGNVRRVLDTDFLPREIYDLGDTKLFRASVLPAVVIAVKGRAAVRPPARFTRVYESPGVAAARAEASILTAITRDAPHVVRVAGKSYTVEVGSLAGGEPGAPWSLLSGESATWLETVRAGTWRTFGEVAKTRVGIKTTADAVFVRDDWDTLPDPPEPELLLPLLTHEDIEPWRVRPRPRARVLYPYDLRAERRTLVDMGRFPRAMAYLCGHEDRLRARGYVTAAGRQWFEIWVPQRPALWGSPKIVFPDICDVARLALDTSGAVVNGDCYWISFADLASEDIGYLMLAVGNSRLGLRFYDTVCGNRLYAGRRRWITQYVDRLPLPSPDRPGARRAIELARRLCAPGVGAGERAELSAEIEQSLWESFSG